MTFAHLETSQAVLRAAFGLMESLEQYLEARQLRLRAGPVDLNRIVLDVRRDLEVVLDGRNVEWSPARLPTVLGDSRALRIILREYVSNALKFTRTRDVTRLQWHVEDTEGHYLIGLQDNGVGFNQRQKDRAFELFGRLHPTGVYEGTGIGLAVVRWLAERGGGRAWGGGKVDQGSTFWVACPKLPSRDEGHRNSRT
ncbi:sensor histidine kinase [Deinococcus radiotolerans]|uniref:sensor histidine kinase n=1 Tax=Deinococcus radiotolerans TaxID=1309407 RepID=UPI001E41FF50|nr:ATP-binding protein [Deinococcus radiotolerans]